VGVNETLFTLSPHPRVAKAHCIRQATLSRPIKGQEEWDDSVFFSSSLPLGGTSGDGIKGEGIKMLFLQENDFEIFWRRVVYSQTILIFRAFLDLFWL
jgi:hypothetical protein